MSKKDTLRREKIIKEKLAEASEKVICADVEIIALTAQNNGSGSEAFKSRIETELLAQKREKEYWLGKLIEFKKMRANFEEAQAAKAVKEAPKLTVTIKDKE